MEKRSFVEVLADRLQAAGPDEFPRGYYEHLAAEREYQHRTKLGIAYKTAMDAGHACACVAIHVGPEVWDYLRSMAASYSGMIPAPTPELVNRLWGYPLILEEDGRPEHISVRATTVIA